MESSIIIFRDIKLETYLKFISQQYRALSDCTGVQAGLTLYWWQRLIAFGFDRIRVNQRLDNKDVFFIFSVEILHCLYSWTIGAKTYIIIQNSGQRAKCLVSIIIPNFESEILMVYIFNIRNEKKYVLYQTRLISRSAITIQEGLHRWDG